MRERDQTDEHLPYHWRRVGSSQHGARRRTMARPRNRAPYLEQARAIVIQIVTRIVAWSVTLLPDGLERQKQTKSPDRGMPRRRRDTRVQGKARVGLPRSWLKPAGLAVAVLLLAILIGNNVWGGGSSHTARSTTTGPELLQPVVAWYAPNGEVFGAIAAGTAYQPIARYGSGWIQHEFDPAGQFWVRTSELELADLTMLPDLQPPVEGYMAYMVAPGDNWQRIAMLGGSDAELIRTYNRVQGPPAPGNPVIVPRLTGNNSMLQTAPLLINHGAVNQPRVALTVDLETGDVDVERMLQVLREHHTRITIFVLGPWVEQHPDLARQIISDGHELANHSLSHADFRTLTDEQIAQELAATEQIVQDITGTSTRPYFRFPYGSHDDRSVLKVIEQGYLPVHWTIDSGDAAGGEKTLEYILEQMTSAQNPADLYGSIILSHCCIRTTTVEALPLVLERFAEMGIEVRPLSEVLSSS